MNMHRHFHPACFSLSGRARLCMACTPSPAGSRPFPCRPELLAAAGWPEAQGMSSASCRAPATWFLHFARSGPPGELNASYFEQNKAQEETEPGSRARRHILSWLQQFRGIDEEKRNGPHNHICGRMPEAEWASESHLIQPLPPANVYPTVCSRRWDVGAGMHAASRIRSPATS